MGLVQNEWLSLIHAILVDFCGKYCIIVVHASYIKSGSSFVKVLVFALEWKFEESLLPFFFSFPLSNHSWWKTPRLVELSFMPWLIFLLPLKSKVWRFECVLYASDTVHSVWFCNFQFLPAKFETSFECLVEWVVIAIIYH